MDADPTTPPAPDDRAALLKRLALAEQIIEQARMWACFDDRLDDLIDEWDAE